jgi:tetratricopeptide (TPR) repeat protein
VRDEPPLPDDVSAAELDRTIRAELASLASVNAETVARHLVMAGRLLDDDPETAHLHAMSAAKRAGRVGAVREAAGLTAYRSGRYAEALAELRAARRITGDHSALPVMADCERGLGRPERALEIAASPEVKTLDASARVEMLIVASGARRDMGQLDAAVLALQGPALRPDLRKSWSARLFYAYADALEAAGRVTEAAIWFGHAVEADVEEATDADVRLAELSGVTFLEADDDESSDQ